MYAEDTPQTSRHANTMAVQLYTVVAVAGTQVRWTGHRLQSTEFHEIAEICKIGIRQLLSSPYDSGRKSC